jgi:pyridinium-3,5-bisthiocarboxylic acid mononucleotide nickel chelatase
MKILQIEMIGGASGDMILGALMELGADAKQLHRELSSLPIEPFEIEAKPFQYEKLHGTQVVVRIHEHPHHHARNLQDIRKIITESRLPERVKEWSLNVFERIAKAEAKVHGTTTDEVHFHEVGALDSMIDIVGCCLGLNGLGVDEVAVGPFPAGRGTIECAHGVFPNPAPATLELLHGCPILQTDETQELVTPTGAALLTTWRTRDAAPDGSRIIQTAYSFGHHKLKRRPNLLRATLLETESTAYTGTCLVIECNLDDTTPELMGSMTQRLLEAGALDTFTTAIQMKKQRPGVLLTVLCDPEKRDLLLDLIFSESTTFGVREYLTRRTMLERRTVDVKTRYGTIRIKIGRWKGQDVTFAPEMDDCIQRARENDAPVRAVFEAATKAAAPLRP